MSAHGKYVQMHMRGSPEKCKPAYQNRQDSGEYAVCKQPVRARSALRDATLRNVPHLLSILPNRDICKTRFATSHRSTHVVFRSLARTSRQGLP